MTNKSSPHCFRGLNVIGWRVIVQVDTAPTMSAGGIDLSVIKKAETQASVVARIMAISPASFNDAARWPQDSRKPEVGDWAIIPSYAGRLIRFDEDKESKDAPDYRILEDKDIMAFSEEKPAVYRPAIA